MSMLSGSPSSRGDEARAMKSTIFEASWSRAFPNAFILVHIAMNTQYAWRFAPIAAIMAYANLQAARCDIARSPSGDDLPQAITLMLKLGSWM